MKLMSGVGGRAGLSGRWADQAHDDEDIQIQGSPVFGEEFAMRLRRPKSYYELFEEAELEAEHYAFTNLEAARENRRRYHNTSCWIRCWLG